MTPTLAAVLLYLLIQFGIGIWVSRRIATEEDYLVAGRRLGYSLATFSIFATWFGAETLVGSAGSAYREGLRLTSAEPFGYGLCLILMGLIFAVPLWRRRLTTLADLYRQRFSPRVEKLAAIILIPGSILWAAAQMRAFGHVITTTTDAVHLETAILIASMLTIAYTTLGGLLVDAITDLIQGIMLIVGLVVVAGAVVAAMGGFGALADAATGPGRLDLVARDVPPLSIVEAWAVPVAGSLIATELVGRIIATRTAAVARGSSLMAGGLYLAIGVIPLTIGLAGPALIPEIADPEQLLPGVARTLLPPIAYAIFAGALISAILSTVDSTLLVAAGLAERNLLAPMLGIAAERAKVRLARTAVVAFGVIAYVLARRAEGVFALVEEASAFGSAGALVTVSFGLFSDFGGPAAAATSLIAGLAAYIGGTVAGVPYPYLLSLAAALAGYVVIGLIEGQAGRAPPASSAARVSSPG